MVNERWVDAFGFEDRYEASTEGNIRHKNPRAGAGILKAFVGKCSGGYARVCICRRKVDGSFHRSRSEMVHRIIWQSFNGPISEGLEINHKNGVKHDNRISNLEPVTKSENAAHAFRVLGRIHPQRGSRAKNAKLNERDIPGLRKRMLNGESKIKLAAEYGVTVMTMYGIAWNKTWTHVPNT